MTIEDVDSIVYRLSYKPHWQISTVEGLSGDDDTVAIRVEIPVDQIQWKPSPLLPDAKRIIFTYPAVSLRSLTSIHSVIELVRRTIMMVEMHEFYEWLCLDGEPVLHPHLSSGEGSF